MRDGHTVKIYRVGRVLVAGAGSTSLCHRFVEWVRGGMTGPSPFQYNAHGNGMVIMPDGKIVVWGEHGPWLVDSPYYAMGSGEKIALGAMIHGASAEEAVACAIQVDVYSGGPIRTLQHA